MFDRNRVQTGFDVYTRDDHKVGSVDYIAPDYFEVSTGFLGLGHPLFVPFNAISRVNDSDQRIYLNVDKDNIPVDMWKQTPTGAGQMAGAGAMAGTMPAATAERGTQTWLTPQQLRGKALYSWDGHKLGDISDVGPNFITVPTGILDLGPTLYVPLDAIDYCDRDGCYASSTLEQIKGMNWNQQRAGMTGTTGMAAQGTARPAAPVPPGGAQALRIPLYEEELEVRRHREQVGQVVIQRNVETQQRTINVPVTHEEVEVERRPVDRPVAPGERPFAEGQREMRVPIYEEKVEVEKVPHEYEEVVVKPEEVTREQQFTGSVRRETAEVEKTGAGFQTGAPTGFRPWTEVMPTYQRDWQTRFPNSGMTWQQVEPAYQFGYTNFYNPAYQNMTWAQAEPRLRQEWQTRYPSSPWDKVRNFVENEWDRLHGAA